ncbi:hypothetical protein B0F90DRAFT_1812019 [Multifurca ochricompacta]|uniref:Tetraspanin Tsp2 n=1 Tax=Multifurca ochricompacta TaxID=376703 RepID=A0AAD4LXY7_9AGAM|nr:hypothetical protein B0F90DRAFT_1812019 [Multifurca ochricompacta]
MVQRLLPHRPDNRHSRRASSIISNANSAYSAATSTRHILSNTNNMHSQLEPPNLPFTSNASIRSVSPRTESPLLGDQPSSHSLSVNYLPNKFSDANRGKGFQLGPKRGGGREAFRNYDGIQVGLFGKEGGRTRPRLRWNRFKWTLFVSNLLFSGYSLAGIIFLLCTWFDVWTHADVVRVGNRTELILSTIAASFGIITSVIGWAGIILNNRSFLAVYTFLLWICFAFLVIPGYLTFKRRNFNLDGKWLRIQNQLNCCGFFSPFVEAAVSQVCYSRSVLPGCKGPYLNFERFVLERWYTIVFGLVPFQIAVILVGLLCSNHITYRFGKGMMPKAYRLSMNSMAVIMETMPAEQYGADVASEVLSRSRSNLHVDNLPTMPYTPSPLSSKQGTFPRMS